MDVHWPVVGFAVWVVGLLTILQVESDIEVSYFQVSADGDF